MRQETGGSTLNVRDRVIEALRACNRTELRALTVKTDGETIELGGVVSTYYAKQLAQTFACNVSGVRELRNAIHVDRGASFPNREPSCLSRP